MNQVVVLGGLTEGKRALDRVGEAATRYYNVENFASFLLRKVCDDPRDFNHAAKGQILITHSGGVITVTSDADPEFLDVYAGPERTSVRRLIRAAGVKLRHQLAGAVAGPNRRGHGRVIGTNIAETAAHFEGNCKLIGQIAAFSTTELILNIGDAMPVRSRVMESDEYFPPQPELINQIQAAGGDVATIAGFHDDLLVDPVHILSET